MQCFSRTCCLWASQVGRTRRRQSTSLGMISLGHECGIFECYCYKYPTVSSFQKFKQSSASEMLYLIHTNTSKRVKHPYKSLQQHETDSSIRAAQCVTVQMSLWRPWVLKLHVVPLPHPEGSIESQSAMNLRQPFSAVSCPYSKNLSWRFVAHFTSRGHCVILRLKTNKKTNVLHMVVSKSGLRIRMMHIEGLPPTVRMPCHRKGPMRRFESMGSHFRKQ